MALSNCGLVLANLGRLGQALASSDKALAIKPDHAKALNNRGNVLQNLKPLLPVPLGGAANLGNECFIVCASDRILV